MDHKQGVSENSFNTSSSVQLSDFGSLGVSPQNDAETLKKVETWMQENAAYVMETGAAKNIYVDASQEGQFGEHTMLVGDAQLHGAFRRAVHPKYLSGPALPPPTVYGPHLTQFHKACMNGKAVVVVMGDSIFAPASDMVAPTENPFYALAETLQQQNPHVQFEFINVACGGMRWWDMDSDTTPPPSWMNSQATSWKAAVAELKPDLLLLHSGGNDAGSFSPESVKGLIKFFLSCPKVPSIILGLPSLPSLVEKYSQNERYYSKDYYNSLDTVVKWLRTYALRNGLGILDFYRWHTMRRDGFDPCEIALTKVFPAENSSLPAYDTWLGDEHTGDWRAPAATNENAVPANAATDFFLSFTLQNRPELLSVDLTGLTPDEKDVKFANQLYVFFNDPSGKIAYSWSDGTFHADTVKILTNINTPQFPAHFCVAVKGTRVVFSVWSPLPEQTWQPDHVLVGMGVGYQTVCDEILVRFGGSFTPRIAWAGQGQIMIHNFCVANTICTSNNQVRNRPDRVDAQLYGHSWNAGGSNAYHMNAYGVRDILAPIIRSQQWFSPAHQLPTVVTGSKIEDSEYILRQILSILEYKNIIKDKTE